MQKKNGWKKVPLEGGGGFGGTTPDGKISIFCGPLPLPYFKYEACSCWKIVGDGRAPLAQKNVGWWCGGPPLVERKVYGEECSACGLVGPSHAQNIFLRG